MKRNVICQATSWIVVRFNTSSSEFWASFKAKYPSLTDKIIKGGRWALVSKAAWSLLCRHVPGIEQYTQQVTARDWDVPSVVITEDDLGDAPEYVCIRIRGANSGKEMIDILQGKYPEIDVAVLLAATGDNSLLVPVAIYHKIIELDSIGAVELSDPSRFRPAGVLDELGPVCDDFDDYEGDYEVDNLVNLIW